MAASRRAWLVVPVAVLALGCGGRQSDAERTLDSYARALERADYGGAYEMMADGFRAKHSREEFARMMRDNPQEVQETTSRLRGARRAQESAEFAYGVGDRLRLVREDGAWRLAHNPIAFYGQDTPREALRSFLRAYRMRRWDVLLRLAPKAYRDRMSVETLRGQFEGERKEEIARLMSQLEGSVDQPIVEKGHEARMSYGEGLEVQFVREDDGRWMIKEPG